MLAPTRRPALTLAILAVSMTAGIRCSHAPAQLPGDPNLRLAGETHLDNLRQLTLGGENIEAHWSYDGKHLVFQHSGPTRLQPNGIPCAQTFSMKTDGSDLRQISNGKGRTDSGYYLPGDDRIVLSSTHATSDQCPSALDSSGGPSWPIQSSHQLYTVKDNGEDLLPFEPAEPRSYNSEAVTCKDGSVVFTSDRDGDLELYRGKLDRLGTISDITRITQSTGYDGGASFSSDCKQIVWQASRPRGEAEAAEDKQLLKRHQVRMRAMEIWVANADGSHARQLTRLGSKSFSPVFFPSGDRVLFSSMQSDAFELYSIRTDGTRLERVTFSNGLESYPMFSPDGKTLAFSSTRHASTSAETNILLADWVDSAPAASLEVTDTEPGNRFKALVEKLSAPALEGRALGTPGLAQAESLVADQFVAAGLRPFYPASSFTQKIEMTIDNGKRVVTAQNIAGIWGRACGKLRPVVLGAHLDRLSVGGGPGADSNASGVAALLETARLIEASGISEIKSCFIFAVFTGEEAGIAGSSQFVAQLKARKLRPKAMLNLDRVGRLENNHLTVFGTASAQEWGSLLASQCSEERLTCEEGGDGYGPSDQLAFYLAGVPVLQFFSGVNADYHQQTDTPDKINATGAIQIAHVAASVAFQVAQPNQLLHFKKAAATPALELPIPGNEKHAGHGAYLGTIPDYAALTAPHEPGKQEDEGIRFAGARPGSPAAKAGVKAGDFLTAIDSRKIRTLEDFMGILVTLNPGDFVVLHLRRGAQKLQVTAQVGMRTH